MYETRSRHVWLVWKPDRKGRAQTVYFFRLDPPIWIYILSRGWSKDWLTVQVQCPYESTLPKSSSCGRSGSCTSQSSCSCLQLPHRWWWQNPGRPKTTETWAPHGFLMQIKPGITVATTSLSDFQWCVYKLQACNKLRTDRTTSAD